VSAPADRRDTGDTAARAASDAILQLHDVRFAWRRGEPDVIDIGHLSVRAGESLFVAGPSGSGKSTLLALLGGVAVPRSGRIEVLGTDLARLGGRLRDRFRADHVGFVFQMFNLVPYLSMLDNVTLACRFSRARSARAVARSGNVGNDARRLLAALELDAPALYTRRVTELSIGQQQRVAVARALIGAPEILIADEPTSALDEGTRGRFLELLFAECAAAHTTLLFVSHDTRLGERFERRVSLPMLNRARTQAAA
jgi:putative ABC transport system ATP-binding protein